MSLSEQTKLLHNLASAINRVASNSEQMQRANNILSDSTLDVYEKLDLLKNEFSEAIPEIERFERSLSGMSSREVAASLKDLTTVMSQLSTASGRVGLFMARAGSSILQQTASIRGATEAAFKLTEGLDTVRTTGIAWQNQMYLGGVSVQALSRNFLTAERAAERYESSVRGVMERTNLGVQGSVQVFQTLYDAVDSYKDASLRSIEDISVALGDLGLTFEKTQEIANQLAPVIGESAFLRQQFAAGIGGRGWAGEQQTTDSGTSAALLLRRSLGMITREQENAIIAAIEYSRRAPENREGEFRSDAIRSQTTLAEREIAGLEVTLERLDGLLLDLADTVETSVSRLVQSNADFVQRMQDIGYTATPVGGVMSSAGSMLLGRRGSSALSGQSEDTSGDIVSGIGRLGMVASTLSGGKGRLGRLGRVAGAATVLSGDATPVYVVNWPPGMGGSTSSPWYPPGSTSPYPRQRGPMGRALQRVGQSSVGRTLSPVLRTGGRVLGAGARVLGPAATAAYMGYDLYTSHGRIEQQALQRGATEEEAQERATRGTVGRGIGAAAGLGLGLLGAAAIASGPPGWILAGLLGGGLAMFGGGVGENIALGDEDGEGEEGEREEGESEGAGASSAGEIEAFRRTYDSELSLREQLRQEIDRYNEKLNESIDDYPDAVAALRDYNARFREQILIAEAGIEVYGRLSQASRYFIDIAGTVENLGEQIESVQTKIDTSIGELRILQEALEKAFEEENAEAVETAQLAIDKLTSEIRGLTVQMTQLEIEQALAPGEIAREITTREARLATAMRDLNTELRISIGRSYQDMINVVQAEMATLATRQGDLQRLMDRYAEAPTDEARRAIYRQILDTKAEIVETRTTIARELRAVREGYLEAFEEVIVGEGAFARIMPQQGEGNQFFAPSPTLGATRGYMGFPYFMQGLQEPAVMTMSGLSMTQDNMTQQHQIYNAMMSDLQGFLPAVFQYGGGSDDVYDPNVAMFQQAGMPTQGTLGTTMDTRGGLPFIYNFGNADPNQEIQPSGRVGGINVPGIGLNAGQNYMEGVTAYVTLPDGTEGIVDLGTGQRTMTRTASGSLTAAGVSGMPAWPRSRDGEEDEDEGERQDVFVVNDDNDPIPVYIVGRAGKTDDEIEDSKESAREIISTARLANTTSDGTSRWGRGAAVAAATPVTPATPVTSATPVIANISANSINPTLPSTLGERRSNLASDITRWVIDLATGRESINLPANGILENFALEVTDFIAGDPRELGNPPINDFIRQRIQRQSKRQFDNYSDYYNQMNLGTAADVADRLQQQRSLEFISGINEMGEWANNATRGVFRISAQYDGDVINIPIRLGGRTTTIPIRTRMSNRNQSSAVPPSRGLDAPDG